MKDFKDLEKSEKKELLSSYPSIIPKFKGVRCYVEMREEGPTLFRSKKRKPITITDLLLSDQYSKILELVNEDPFFEQGHHYMITHNMHPEFGSRFIVDEDNGDLPDRLTSKKREDLYFAVDLNSEGEFGPKDIEKRLTNTGPEDFTNITATALGSDPMSWEVKDFIIRSSDKEVKSHVRAEEPKPLSEMCNIIQRDIIMLIEEKDIRESGFNVQDSEETFLLCVSKTMIDFLEKNTYELYQLELELPHSLRVENAEKKAESVPGEVSEVLSENPLLYDLYTLFILTLKGPNIEANDYLNDHFLNEWKSLCSVVQDVCKDPLNETKLPDLNDT